MGVKVRRGREVLKTFGDINSNAVEKKDVKKELEFGIKVLGGNSYAPNYSIREAILGTDNFQRNHDVSQETKVPEEEVQTSKLKSNFIPEPDPQTSIKHEEPREERKLEKKFECNIPQDNDANNKQPEEETKNETSAVKEEDNTIKKYEEEYGGDEAGFEKFHHNNKRSVESEY